MGFLRRIDFHVHINNLIPIEQTVRNFSDMCERFGYDGIGIMSISISADGSFVDDLMCNSRALEIKKRMPGSFAFAALNHKRDFIEQTKEYMQSGFDGIKLLEGKPSVYKYYGYGIESKRFYDFFEYAQNEQIPIMLHNCDPEQNWDINRADERAKKMGWCYDETVPPQSFFYNELERVLENFPELKMAIAHMGFYADRLDTASRLLDSCPNLYLDITPALIIFSQLSQNKNSKKFFEKYNNRLIYGTDADNDLTGFARSYNDKKVRVITAFLENDAPCEIDGITVNPIHADKETLKKIYAENALAFLNKA